MMGSYIGTEVKNWPKKPPQEELETILISTEEKTIEYQWDTTYSSSVL
jgi:hypothetical protein